MYTVNHKKVAVHLWA